METNDQTQQPPVAPTAQATTVAPTTTPAAAPAMQQQPQQNQQPPKAATEQQAPQQPPNQQAGTILGGGQEQTQYDFASILPQGMQLDQQRATEFGGMAKELNLTNEQAQQVAKYGIEYAQSALQQVEENRQQEIAGWGESARKELGQDFDKIVADAGAAIEAISQQMPGFRQMLEETGVGNRVEVIRVMSMLGALTREDGFKGFGKPAGYKDDLYTSTNFDIY